MSEFLPEVLSALTHIGRVEHWRRNTPENCEFKIIEPIHNADPKRSISGAVYLQKTAVQGDEGYAIFTMSIQESYETLLTRNLIPENDRRVFECTHCTWHGTERAKDLKGPPCKNCHGTKRLKFPSTYVDLVTFGALGKNKISTAETFVQEYLRDTSCEVVWELMLDLYFLGGLAEAADFGVDPTPEDQKILNEFFRLGITLETYAPMKFEALLCVDSINRTDRCGNPQFANTP